MTLRTATTRRAKLLDESPREKILSQVIPDKHRQNFFALLKGGTGQWEAQCRLQRSVHHMIYSTDRLYRDRPQRIDIVSASFTDHSAPGDREPASPLFSEGPLAYGAGSKHWRQPYRSKQTRLEDAQSSFFCSAFLERIEYRNRKVEEILIRFAFPRQLPHELNNIAGENNFIQILADPAEGFYQTALFYSKQP